MEGREVGDTIKIIIKNVPKSRCILFSMYYAQCKHFLDPVKFYRRKTGPVVALASGWCVVRIDADDHVAYVEDTCEDVPIYYEKCLFAPGKFVGAHLWPLHI